MQAGDLRERITIRRRTETKNAGGGLDIGWSTVANSISANIVSINSREAVIGGVLQGNSYFDITVRYRTDLEVSDQIVWGSRELNLIAAEDREGKRHWTNIQASTEAPQGA